jgi:hypothetical protein
MAVSVQFDFLFTHGGKGRREAFINVCGHNVDVKEGSSCA